MSFWKSGLKPAQSDYLYLRHGSPLPCEVRMILFAASWCAGLSLDVLRFLRTCRSRCSWRPLPLVILLVMGCLFAYCVTMADYEYKLGMDQNATPQERIRHYRLAAQYNPLDYQNRIASANAISNFALSYNDLTWLNAAKIENGHAILYDPTSADLLQKAILVDLALKDFKEAQLYYNQFKKVDRKSPINELVAKAHQQGRTPVAAKP